MLATYKRYRDVPTQLHLFFERAYNTLLSEHDFLKTGFRRRFYTSIDSMYYAQYFSEFCARSYDAKMLDFTDQQFCELMAPVIQRQHLTNGALPIDFLYDAVISICIMYKEGYEYHFIHRSFQEYFTAKFYEIANLADDSITRKLLEGFIECEAEHRAWVAQHMGIIKRIGYENYLTLQLGD